MIEKLKTLVGDSRVFLNEKLDKYTTFRVGGPAKALVLVDTIDELQRIYRLIREAKAKFFIIGNGSNLLVSDEGYDGIVIKLQGDFDKISVENDKLTAGAGVILTKVCTTACKENLSGLEFAYGIPGTVGGAMVMNAGAYDGEMSYVVEEVRVLTENGDIKTLSNSDMRFGYRDSVSKHEFMVILETVFKLSKGESGEIKAKMDDFLQRRKDKQPLEYPSAGSTFKRPEGNFAGKLIMEAGLSGKRVGGACVSAKHCGFVVNDKNATATDIIELMDIVIDTVERTSGITLEPEVITIGFTK